MVTHIGCVKRYNDGTKDRSLENCIFPMLRDTSWRSKSKSLCRTHLNSFQHGKIVWWKGL